MALESTDLLVVQKAAGDKSNKSLSIDTLTTYIENAFNASAAVVYKGPGDMNDSNATPSTPSTGDLYINSEGDATDTFQWTQGASGADPNPAITHITVNLGGIKNIYNQLGELLISSRKKTIDISLLKAEIYLLQSEKQTQKFIKQ